MVNMSGKRFMNESMPYVEAGHKYAVSTATAPAPARTSRRGWCSISSRDRYIFAGLQPGQRIPTKWMESGVTVKADTLG